MSTHTITKPYPDIELIRHEDGRGHYYTANGKKVQFSPSGISNLLDKPQLKWWYASCMEEELLAKITAGEPMTPAIISNAKKAWERKIDREADYGSQVHEFAEKMVKGIQPPMPEHPKARRGAIAWLEWFDRNHIETIESESHVYSKKYKFAGTTDLLARVNGKIAIVDYKAAGPKDPLSDCCEKWVQKRDDGYTCKGCGGDCLVKTKGVYSSYRYQTVMYQIAREEMRPADGRRSFEPGEIEERWVIRFDKLTGQFEAHRLDNRKKDEEAVKALLKIAKREKELT